MSLTATYSGFPPKERARLAAVGAKAAFLVSDRESRWRRDASVREYWSERLRGVFKSLGFDQDIEVFARAAFDRFGYVADWESSPKTKDAWRRRMCAALNAIEQDLAGEADLSASALARVPPKGLGSAHDERPLVGSASVAAVLKSPEPRGAYATPVMFTLRAMR